MLTIPPTEQGKPAGGDETEFHPGEPWAWFWVQAYGSEWEMTPVPPGPEKLMPRATSPVPRGDCTLLHSISNPTHGAVIPVGGRLLGPRAGLACSDCVLGGSSFGESATV